MADLPAIDTVVFDMDGVLVDWSPRYLYAKLFDDEAEREHFLANVVNQDWNERHDEGVSFAAVDIFGSERLTGALLDRLNHHVHILECKGESYRLKHARGSKKANRLLKKGFEPFQQTTIERRPRQSGNVDSRWLRP